MSRVLYGGQAVIEGVMMRGPRHLAVAVRHPSGQIVTKTEELTGVVYRARWTRWPFVRGVLALWDALGLGMKALLFAANVAADEEDDEGERKVLAPGEQPILPEMPAGVMWGTLIVSLAFAVGIFFVTPVLIVGYLDRFITSSIVSNLVEKVIRLALILGYMGGIGLLPDIRRVYAYHGAEHKTINAFEAGVPLRVDAVRRFTTVHPRCGTTFLIVVVLVSFVLFALLGQPPILLRVLSRVVLIPVVAGVAFEVVRLAANHFDNHVVRTLMSPGLAVQSLTTREPDDSQLEVAIASLQAVLDAEQESRETRIAA